MLPREGRAFRLDRRDDPQVQALHVLDQPLQPPRRIVHRGDHAAVLHQLGHVARLAARRGAEVEDVLARLRPDERRDRGAGIVLHLEEPLAESCAAAPPASPAAAAACGRSRDGRASTCSARRLSISCSGEVRSAFGRMKSGGGSFASRQSSHARDVPNRASQRRISPTGNESAAARCAAESAGGGRTSFPRTHARPGRTSKEPAAGRDRARRRSASRARSSAGRR